MTEPKTQEPSMEEILASIRRIISEEGGTPAAGGAGPAADAAAPPPDTAETDDVLELTDLVEPEPVEETVRRIDPPPAPRPVLVTPEPRYDPEPQPMSEPLHEPMTAPDRALVSNEAASSTANTFAELAALVAREEAERNALPLGQAGRSIEDIVRELLRPLLREWLDRHLPGTVERLVRQEIERLVRLSQDR